MTERARLHLHLSVYGPDRDAWTVGGFVSWDRREAEGTLTVHLFAWQLVVEVAELRWWRP